jgi:acyl carrier protein
MPLKTVIFVSMKKKVQIMETIYNELKKVLTKNFFLNPLAVQPTKFFYKDLGLNSLEFLEMVVMVEQFFGIEIPDERLRNIRTVRQMAECIDDILLVEA